MTQEASCLPEQFSLRSAGFLLDERFRKLQIGLLHFRKLAWPVALYKLLSGAGALCVEEELRVFGIDVVVDGVGIAVRDDLVLQAIVKTERMAPGAVLDKGYRFDGLEVS